MSSGNTVAPRWFYEIRLFPYWERIKPNRKSVIGKALKEKSPVKTGLFQYSKLFLFSLSTRQLVNLSTTSTTSLSAQYSLQNLQSSKWFPATPG
jgi:hypothetical protein